jgi:ATP-binding cassette, subfamily B, bacterial
MLSILFIINQLNTPISSLINFIINTQIISNSFQRIFEIHNVADEDTGGLLLSNTTCSDILMSNVSFGYFEGTPIIKDISLTIPRNKTTAIVGYSGSGKTTILKLLLKFYKQSSGNIYINNSMDLSLVKSSLWRDQCGAVLQESSIYSSSLEYNITLQNSEEVNYDLLNQAINLACLTDFVNELPLGTDTKLSLNGLNISSGQKQRVLLARLIYKNPQYVFLDEATNSLDANTERVILENLSSFFTGKTVVVVAHRLSTVMNADQIVVLDKGKVVETGDHRSLIENKGSYYTLIKNQLDLEYESA